jgi:hypothetical protein
LSSSSVIGSGSSSFPENVKEHAPPLAGASVETGVWVHVTGEVADNAARGGCCVSTCWAFRIHRCIQAASFGNGKR